MGKSFCSYPRQAIALGVVLFMLLMAASLTGALQAWSDTQTVPLDAASIPKARPLDLSTTISQNVELLGQLGGFMSSVALQGDTAYVGIGASLVILDVSDPAHPFAVGQTLPFPDLVSNVAVSGTHAYVADNRGGLRIVDVSDPAQPTEIGFYRAWDAVAEGVAVSGTHAYVAAVRGLHILDISDPASPQHTGFYTTTRIAFNVAIVGNYAYVAVDRVGLRVMDVSDPAHPKEVGSCCSPSILYAGDVAVAGDYAYVADYYDHVNIVSIADPAHPTRVSTFATPGPVFAVAVANGQAYVVDIGGLSIITVTEPLTPVLASYITAWGDAKDVAVSDGRAYVAAQASGLHIFNVANPTQPSLAGEYDTPLVSSTDVAEAGTFAYVTDYYYGVNVRGLRMINATDPAHPFKSGELRTLGEAQGVAVSGPYAYIADGSQGLRVVNAADPAHPIEMNPVPMSGGALGVKVAGNYAYVAAGYLGGLRVVKVSDPASPEEVGAIDTPGGANQVAVAGDFAYVADGYSGLRIVNVADRKHPFEAGAFTATLTSAQDVAVAGSTAYVADGSGTLYIVNVADPAHPFEAGHYSTPGCVANVAVLNDLAYVGDCDALRVINVANPTHPTLAGYHELAQAYPVAVTAEGLIYVIGERAGLTILRFHLGPPSADFGGSPTSGQRPLTVSFTEAGVGADTWLWSFGDGAVSTSPTLTHTYTAAGAYTVSLRVSNAAGSDILTRTHYITVSGLSAAFSAAPTMGRSPLTVTFANQSTGYMSSLWDFGDGVTSTLDSPTHTYTAVGAYTVTLTVSGPDGSDTAIKPAFIAVVEPRLYLPIAMNGYTPPETGPRFVAASGTDTGNDCRVSAAPCATIQHAVDVAAAGDEIRIASARYTDLHVRARNDITTTVVVTQIVYLDKSVSLVGGYTTSNWSLPDPKVHPTILDAQGQGRGIFITGASPTLEGLDITGGATSGTGGFCVLPFCDGAGGGIYVVTATATISGCRVYSNTSADGGGIFLVNSPAILTNNTVGGNSAWYGGGISLEGSHATLSGNTIYSNTSTWSGGGLKLSRSPATLSDNLILGNTSSYGDGGGAYLSTSDATLISNTIQGNASNGSDYRINQGGGGIYVGSSNAMLSGNAILSNTARLGGGGVRVGAQAPTLSGNVIAGNAAFFGSGVYLSYDASTLNGNRITGNKGDGAYLSRSAATLVNNVIADNVSSEGGYGVAVMGGSSQLIHNTIARNGSGNSVGVYVSHYQLWPKAEYATVALTNTIIASHTVGISVTTGNTVTVNGVLWFSAPLTISQATTATVTVQNQYEGDPVFAADGYHLMAGSAAIDRGVEAGVTTDIDGNARPYGPAPDLGAVEYLPPSRSRQPR